LGIWNAWSITMLKLATTEQIDFYKKILYPIQDEIFALLQSNKFYLTGGTCLSRFYFHHRYSDDLDFFFLGHIHSKEDFEIEFTIIIQRIRKRFKTEITINGEYFKRVIVFENDHELKLEFIYDTTPVVVERVSYS
jgi:predicted nucleotidyltransferase component of viral defense system